MNEQPSALTALQAQLAALQQSIANLEKAGVGKSAIAPLREQVASIQQEIQTAGGAFVGGHVDTGGGMFAGRDINFFIPRSAQSIADLLKPQHLSAEVLQKSTETYLHALWDRHCYLRLKGMGVSNRVPLKLPLLELYVPLKARLELPEGETWKRDLRLAGRALSEEEPQALTGRLSAAQPVLDLLQQHAGLIILGDPGAGKTTFLKFLALRLAVGEGDALGLGQRLPILLPLSAYANALAERDVRLDDFIANYFHDIGANLPVGDIVREALARGAALLLLDGLDEVRRLDLRHTVVERVVDFYTFHRRVGNKFVLTSRIVGYREVRPMAEGLAECTLVDFDEEEIADFVTRWTAALERQAQGEGVAAQTDAERECRELLDAVAGNEGVRQLASNPLLLTILALMKRQGVTLPERRVELYDQYVRTLLSSWNRARGLGRPPTRDLDVVQTVRILAPLALWMHEVNPGVGLVKREALRRHLEAIYAGRGEPDAETAAQRFLEDVREHAGLLLERGAGEYGFIHLTFEEYLAAVAIALAGQGDCRPIVKVLGAHVGDPAWREVSLLAVAYVGIIQQLDSVAGDVVEALVKEARGEPGAAVVLAGAAVLDAGASGVLPRSRTRVIEHLVTTMQAVDVAPLLRREAGLLLGQLGWQPEDLDAFVEVPAGKFLYGDDKETREIPYRYWMGKYPVTNAQYARFVEDGGYDQREVWSEEGWAWKEKEGRCEPGYWDNVERSNPIFPVVGVTWYEAEAYCRWLTQRLNDEGPKLQVWRQGSWVTLDGGQHVFEVRLPTEEEWERAARGPALSEVEGPDGREYPWGDDFSFARANVAEEFFKGMGTTAVCTYPQGVSPVGAWDMSGNVGEWTSSWGDEKQRQRVFRGGSWFDVRQLARCAYRYGNVQDNFYNYVGFRVLLSLVNSGF